MICLHWFLAVFHPFWPINLQYIALKVHSTNHDKLEKFIFVHMLSPWSSCWDFFRCTRALKLSKFDSTRLRCSNCSSQLCTSQQLNLLSFSLDSIRAISIRVKNEEYLDWTDNWLNLFERSDGKTILFSTSYFNNDCYRSYATPAQKFEK